MRPFLIPSFLCLVAYFSIALSFSVTVGSAPDECGSLSVTWTGGLAPFEIMLIPSFNIPRNISVPSSAFNNNQGSYQISPFPFSNGIKFLVTMSDATGFGTGGVSQLLTVGDPVGSVSCDTSNSTLPFVFSLPSSLQQCSPYIFDGYDGAALPITITGFIPGGDFFLLHTPSTGTSFTWTANVAAGTTIIFSVTDALGNSGGSSSAEMVAPSNNVGCLSNTSPSSTASPTPSSTTTNSPPSSGISPGTIAGIVVGAILAIAATVPVAICFLKRGRSPFGLAPMRNPRRPNSVELDLDSDNIQHPSVYPFLHQTDDVNHLAPPTIPGSPAMVGVSSYRPATRIIVHTDDGDDVPVSGDEVVELPPQYSEWRAPAATHTDR